MKKADLIGIKVNTKKIIIACLIIFSFSISFLYYKQNKQITQLKIRIDQQDNTSRNLDSRIDDLESQNSDLEGRVNDLESRIDDLESYRRY